MSLVTTTFSGSTPITVEAVPYTAYWDTTATATLGRTTVVQLAATAYPTVPLWPKPSLDFNDPRFITTINTIVTITTSTPTMSPTPQSSDVSRQQSEEDNGNDQRGGLSRPAYIGLATGLAIIAALIMSWYIYMFIGRRLRKPEKTDMQRERDEESWAGGDGHAMPRLPPRVSRANAQRPGVVRQAEDAGGGEPPPPYVEHTADRAVAPGEGRGGC